jgi:adenine-specific DNA-methyltransferase
MNKPYKNNDDDGRGLWRTDNLLVKSFSKSGVYTIQNPNTGVEYSPAEGSSWRASKTTMQTWLSENRIYFGKDGTGAPQLKRYLSEVQDGQVPTTWWKFEEVGHNDSANKELAALFESKAPFDTPKPTTLIKQMLKIGCNKDALALDFFAGSGTTAHAVMALNLEDGGTRQCISIQMPEVLDEDSEAYKAGYRTIADITRARIDKVIAKLQAEHPDKTTDLACAHFTLAPSNFKVWRGDANSAEALREQLQLFQSAEKMDSRLRGNDSANQTAMLAELLLKNGLGALGVHAISKPKQVAGVTIYRVRMPDDRDMWLCFEPYTEALKTEITKAKPAKVVMLNSCFVGPKADELLSNLQLELAALDIGLTVI